MLKPNNIIRNCSACATTDYVPECFSLLSWNIYKINHKKPADFQAVIKDINRACAVKFYCLQEAKYNDGATFPLKGFALYFAANLQLKSHAYGVLTASNVKCRLSEQILSKKTEFLLNTHKSSLVNHYVFADRTPLILINVHAINFKNTKAYGAEIEQLHDYLQACPDAPTVIAGDFNCWNQKRKHLIRDFCQQLDLTLADFTDAHHIKHFARHPLDLVMYKNLNCELATAIERRKISDHNPLLLKFSR